MNKPKIIWQRKPGHELYLIKSNNNVFNISITFQIIPYVWNHCSTEDSRVGPKCSFNDIHLKQTTA